MNIAKFIEVSNDELLSVNGGGVGGAVLGCVVGGTVGYVAGGIAYKDSIRSGSSPAMARKAASSAYLSSVTTCTVIGSYLPF